MGFFRRFFRHSPKGYAVALVLAAVITVLALVQRGFDLLIYYADSFGIAGGIVFFLGLLLLVTYLGAFDTFGYAFSALGKNRRYRDLAEYTIARKEKRSHGEWFFSPYITVGAVFLLAGLILSLCV